MREKEIRKAAQTRKTDRRTEIRASSVQLLLSLIERGSMTTKENLLNNRALTSPLIKFLALDSDEIILSVIETLKTHVLNDKKLTRAVKTGFFASENLLSKLITLAEHDNIHSEQLTNTAEQFLVDACTIPGNGICFEDRGWYPRADATATDEVESKLHNVILYRFLIQLRPVENIFHRTLALAILKQSQELVAPFFARLQISNNVNLTFSLISSLSLWTEIIDLPLPNPFGDTTGLPEDPPPIATAIGSIMPAIFTKAYLSSGILSGKPLIRLYMLQLVYTVLNKVQLLKTAAQSGNQKWHDQFDSILETISRRLPDPQTVLKVYTTSSEHQLNASAAVKVLVLYTDLLSAISVMPRIDAKLITSALQTQWNFTSPTGFFNQLYFLRVIHEQGDINWWSKQGT
jgi:nucleolar pre-ribosomal-associated protein 1